MQCIYKSTRIVKPSLITFNFYFLVLDTSMIWVDLSRIRLITLDMLEEVFETSTKYQRVQEFYTSMTLLKYHLGEK